LTRKQSEGTNFIWMKVQGPCILLAWNQLPSKKVKNFPRQ